MRLKQKRLFKKLVPLSLALVTLIKGKITINMAAKNISKCFRVPKTLILTKYSERSFKIWVEPKTFSLMEAAVVEEDRNHVKTRAVQEVVVEPGKFVEPAKPTPDAGLNHFRLCGKDRKWHAAQARIEGDTVKVTSGKVPAPAGR